jgi:hypothetical protein
MERDEDQLPLLAGKRLLAARLPLPAPRLKLLDQGLDLGRGQRPRHEGLAFGLG